MRFLRVAVVSTVLMIVLSGCAAIQVALEHKDLDVQTKMSESIMLPPVGPKDMTVWVIFRNTSDKDIQIDQSVRGCLAAKGYRLVFEPSQAHYYLQVNVLQVGKTSPSAAQSVLLSGYGGALAGGTAGALIGASTGSYTSAAVGVGAGALLGGLAETAANSLVHDTTFAAVTDVQVAERSDKPIAEQSESHVRQGTSTVVNQSVGGSAHMLMYRTRVLSTANKVNLEFGEALPHLQGSLSRVICGVF